MFKQKSIYLFIVKIQQYYSILLSSCYLSAPEFTLPTLPTPTQPDARILLLRLFQYPHETYALQDKKLFARVSLRMSQTRRPCSHCNGIVKVEMTSPQQACEQEDRPYYRVHILISFRNLILAFLHLKGKSAFWDR